MFKRFLRCNFIQLDIDAFHMCQFNTYIDTENIFPEKKKIQEHSFCFSVWFALPNFRLTNLYISFLPLIIVPP